MPMKSKYEKKDENFVPDVTIDEEMIKEDKARLEKMTYMVLVSNLALRIGPGFNYDKIGIAPFSDVVVDKVENNFGRLADGSGWICLDYAKRIR